MPTYSFFLTQIEYDNFPYVLIDEIRNRAYLQHKLFEESELWYLVYTLLAAGNDFHESGKKVGDIRPQNVFINEDGQVKVATHLTWPGEQNNYHKTFYEKETTFLGTIQLSQPLRSLRTFSSVKSSPPKTRGWLSPFQLG